MRAFHLETDESDPREIENWYNWFSGHPMPHRQGNKCGMSRDAAFSNIKINIFIMKTRCKVKTYSRPNF